LTKRLTVIDYFFLSFPVKTAAEFLEKLKLDLASDRNFMCLFPYYSRSSQPFKLFSNESNFNILNI